MKSRRAAFLLALVGLLAPRTFAAELKQKTVEAFEHYVRLAEQRMDKELGPGEAYLWIDSLPQPRRQRLYDQLRSGQIVLQPLKTEQDEDPISVPDGLIHHWVGVVFIPGATLPQAVAVLQDYDNHSKIYAPDIRRSKLIRRDGNDFQIYIQFYKKAIFTVVLNAEFRVRFSPVDAERVSSRSYSTRIAELENPDRPEEREYPIGRGHGFLWRLNSYWRLEQKDGGVYAQLEYVALSRNVPTGLGWLVHPIVRRISRESLSRLLNATRGATAGKLPGASGEASPSRTEPNHDPGPGSRVDHGQLGSGTEVG